MPPEEGWAAGRITLNSSTIYVTATPPLFSAIREASSSVRFSDFTGAPGFVSPLGPLHFELPSPRLDLTQADLITLYVLDSYVHMVGICPIGGAERGSVNSLYGLPLKSARRSRILRDQRIKGLRDGRVGSSNSSLPPASPGAPHRRRSCRGNGTRRGPPGSGAEWPGAQPAGPHAHHREWPTRLPGGATDCRASPRGRRGSAEGAASGGARSARPSLHSAVNARRRAFATACTSSSPTGTWASMESSRLARTSNFGDSDCLAYPGTERRFSAGEGSLRTSPAPRAGSREARRPRPACARWRS